MQFRLCHLVTLTVVATVAVNAFLVSWRLLAIFLIALIPAYLLNRAFIFRCNGKTSYWRGVFQTALFFVVCLAMYMLSIGPAVRLVLDFDLDEEDSIVAVMELFYAPLGLIDESDHPLTPYWIKYRESWYPDASESEAGSLPSNYYTGEW